MKKNMSKTDGIIRIIVAVVIAALWYTGLIGGILFAILGVISVIFIITGFVNFCPLYAVLGIRTRAKTN